MAMNRPVRAALAGTHTVKASKVEPDHPFRFNMRLKAMSSGSWIRTLVVAALGLTVAVLFVQLFVAVAVGTVIVFLVRSAAQRALGPGSRIQLRIPSKLSARFKAWMWRR
ncbi:hypothetical protein MSR1_03110 [Magnetospirillum gryphiswaldense MSR-1]|uniref:Uncharacterized protein n=1 Tax=Magnetospirillum gryphiswaldense TaxID=55518 RepID=Q3BKD8_9PROT|nr:hypothetical protein MSR1_03110 [Magnetospirillum gryphiswaldense MSR-1]AVM76728.1 hypothetical protein MSR1L_03110 [Magnetospirillum gryphiswaldense]CAJ30089.1 hypothetical protein mgI451 [Magnetospirillum gryphiswaldense MSR-1]CAM77998.1 hypothetical protein MGR_4066 [Magnetospirillum gryphiswaldense MSR-1]